MHILAYEILSFVWWKDKQTKSQGVDKEWMQVNKGKNKVFPELVIEERGEALGFPAVLVRVQLVTRERVALSFS